MNGPWSPRSEYVDQEELREILEEKFGELEKPSQKCKNYFRK